MSLFFYKMGSVEDLHWFILMIFLSEPHMLQTIKELNDIANEKNLNLALLSFFFILITVEYLRHEKDFNTIKPIKFKLAAVHTIPSPNTKIKLMKVICSMNLSCKLMDKLLLIGSFCIIYIMMLLHFTGLINWQYYFSKLKFLIQKCYSDITQNKLPSLYYCSFFFIWFRLLLVPNEWWRNTIYYFIRFLNFVHKRTKTLYYLSWTNRNRIFTNNIRTH